MVGSSKTSQRFPHHGVQEAEVRNPHPLLLRFQLGKHTQVGGRLAMASDQEAVSVHGVRHQCLGLVVRVAQDGGLGEFPGF